MASQFPEALDFLFDPARYKVAWGGRGAAKSWGFARAALVQGGQRTLRILCARETQRSIADSVHALLGDQVQDLGLDEFYRVQQATILGRNGSEFIFHGGKDVLGAIYFCGSDPVALDYGGASVAYEPVTIIRKRFGRTLFPGENSSGKTVALPLN